MSHSARDMERLWRLLADIEDGTVTLTLTPEVNDPEDGYCLNNHFDGSDGSRVVVFNDCGQWDYLDLVILADGTRFGFEDCPTYSPPDEALPRYLNRFQHT